jgi:hypothetical protein
MSVEGKCNLFLDLDQTLIDAQLTEEFDFKTNKKKLKKFDYHDMDGYYIVFERPNLKEFLDYIFDNFNVSIWTAASRSYATFIIQNIILGNNENRNLDYVLFSYHCKLSEQEKGGTKALSMIWNIINDKNYTKDNTIILDDYDHVSQIKDNNCIQAPEFYFHNDNSENDNYLIEVKEKLEEFKNNN